MPKWLSAIAEAAQILAFLESPKNLISENVESLCFEQAKISSQWERVIIVSKLPINFTRQQIEEKVLEIVKKRRGIVRDIYIPEGDVNSPKSEIKQELEKLFELKKNILARYQEKKEAVEKKISEHLEKEKKQEENKEEKGKEEVKTIEEKEEYKSPEDQKADTETQNTQPDTSAPSEAPSDIVPQPTEETIESTDPPGIDWNAYNHQGAVIIVLDEFDLGLLTEEDQRVEEEPEEEKEEVEVPPELIVYNCSACTFENPMTNSTCSICGTPRPPDAGQKKEEGKKDEPEEEHDSTKHIEDKFILAINNRIELITKDIKHISVDADKSDNEEIDKAKKEVEAKQAELDRLLMANNLSPADKSNANVEQLVKASESLQNVEEMNLGRLFDDPDAEGEQNKPQEEQEPPKEEHKDAQNPEEKKDESKAEDIKDEPKPEDNKEEPKHEENKDESKPEENKDEPKPEQADKVNENKNESEEKDEDKKEGEKTTSAPNEETKQPEEPKEEPIPTLPPHEEIKIFFGHTIEDDYKSEVYLNTYLKQLLLTSSGALTEE